MTKFTDLLTRLGCGAVTREDDLCVDLYPGVPEAVAINSLRRLVRKAWAYGWEIVERDHADSGLRTYGLSVNHYELLRQVANDSWELLGRCGSPGPNELARRVLMGTQTQSKENHP